jgi:hypothetical protein
MLEQNLKSPYLCNIIEKDSDTAVSNIKSPLLTKVVEKDIMQRMKERKEEELDYIHNNPYIGIETVEMIKLTY